MTRVKMVLAQGPDRPEGDVEDWLVMLIGLTHHCQIDVEAHQRAASPWLATRRRHGAVQRLEVIRLDEGWALQSVEHQDDPICTFDAHLFRPGELVRVRQPGGQDLLYRIVAIESANDEHPSQAISA